MMILKSVWLFHYMDNPFLLYGIYLHREYECQMAELCGSLYLKYTIPLWKVTIMLHNRMNGFQVEQPIASYCKGRLLQGR